MGVFLKYKTQLQKILSVNNNSIRTAIGQATFHKIFICVKNILTLNVLLP